MELLIKSWSHHDVKPTYKKLFIKSYREKVGLYAVIHMYKKMSSNKKNWPLHEYHEKYIMQMLSSLSSQSYSSPSMTKAKEIFYHDRSRYCLRCSICQRKFHSEGNLFNHKQLYH